MRFKKRLAACQRLVQSFVITGVMAAMSSWAIASEMPEPGHKSMVVVDGYFQYHYGAWATYTIHDLTTDEESTIFFSTLEREAFDGKPAMWMEIVVQPEGQEEVVTRVLLEETLQGPGKPFEIVVQPHGMEPFTVPESFMAEAEGGSEKTNVIKPGGAVKKVKIKVGDRRLKGVLVQGKDDHGRPVEAVVSNELPPLGLVRVKTQDISMELNNFGANAKTKIEGTPINFYLWLSLQIGKGLSGENNSRSSVQGLLNINKERKFMKGLTKGTAILGGVWMILFLASGGYGQQYPWEQDESKQTPFSSQQEAAVEKDQPKSEKKMERLTTKKLQELYKEGNKYYFGKGVAKDLNKAFALHLRAAEEGFAMSQYAVGKFYLEGKGTAKDDAAAFKWLSRSADQGYGKGQMEFGRLYFKGWGVTQDYDKALHWFRKSAAQGNKEAETFMGVLYERGLGVEKDLDLAISYYRKAAKKGEKGAQRNLARLTK